MNNMAVGTMLKYPGVSNEIPVQDLEENIIKICKDTDIDISHMDIQGCHRLPLGINTTNTAKHVTRKFVNRKHSEAMVQQKKYINITSKVLVLITHYIITTYIIIQVLIMSVLSISVGKV